MISERSRIMLTHRKDGHRKDGRSRASLLALAAAAMLAGCASHSERHFTTGSVPDHYKTRHPIVLTQKERTLDVPVAMDVSVMPLAHRSLLVEYAQRFRRAGGGRLTMMLPDGSPNAGTARRIGHQVLEVLAEEGVAAASVHQVSYAAGQHGPTAPIRLSYGALQADVGPCGQWPADLVESSDHKNYHNFGCATQKALAAQIAEPSDLIQPRGMATVDPVRRQAVIDNYRSRGNP